MNELPSNIYYIKRKGEITGFHVRIKISGTTFSKVFGIKKFGDAEKAYKESHKYLQSICKQHGVEIKERRAVSEIPGVSRTDYIDRSSGKPVRKAFWQAQWQSAPGQQETKRYSILTHGEEKAKTLAIEKRHQAISAIESGKDPIFVPPKALRAKLWRYMDFTKFVSMLDNSAIYFCQADLLGDPYEGSYSRGNEKQRKFVYSRQKEPNKNMDELVAEIRERRKGIMISCWHMSNHESAAMWRLYAKSNEAVCIQTTYLKLESSLCDDANIGMVNYIDFERHWIPEGSYYYPFMYKRKSFEHERELRALVDMQEVGQTELFRGNKNGFWWPTDLSRLIVKVYVSPESPEWFLELTKNICKKYNIDCPVVNSKLVGQPIY